MNYSESLYSKMIKDLESNNVEITQLQKMNNFHSSLNKEELFKTLKESVIRYIDIAEGFILKGKKYFIECNDRIIDIHIPL